MDELSRSGGISTKLNKALKTSKGERVSIQWGNEPWEKHRMKFVKPDDIEARRKDRMTELDDSLKSHAGGEAEDGEGSHQTQGQADGVAAVRDRGLSAREIGRPDRVRLC